MELHRIPWFHSWVGKIRWIRDRLLTPVFLGFPCGSVGKESACNVGDLGSIPGLGRYPEEGNGYPLQYSGLENSMDCIVHGVTKIWTQQNDFHFHSILKYCIHKYHPPQLKHLKQERNHYWSVFSDYRLSYTVAYAQSIDTALVKAWDV